MSWSSDPAALPLVRPHVLPLAGTAVRVRPASGGAEAEARAAERARAEAERRHQSEMDAAAARHAAEMEELRSAHRADTERLAAIVAEASREMRGLAHPWADAVEANVLALAIALARHVIGEVAERDEDLMRTSVRRVVDLLGPVEGMITLRLSPEDHRAAVDGGLADTLDGIRLLSDDRVARGGAVVESATRIVDGDIESRLAALYRELTSP